MRLIEKAYKYPGSWQLQKKAVIPGEELQSGRKVK
jgi:hypothetical protein